MLEPGARTVVVLGGAGYFGRLLLEDLLATTRAPLCAVGRSASRLARLARELDPAGRRLTVRVQDVRDRAGLGAVLQPGDVVVDCAGPFQTRGLEAVETTVDRGAHFIDIADARNYIAAVRARRDDWARSTANVLSGASAVPGLVVLLAARAAAGLDRTEAIRTWMAPGNRDPRRHATVYSLLDDLCRPFAILRAGRREPVQPWSHPMTAAFPAPVGDRIGYLMSGVDADVLPEYFADVQTCELRVGSELRVLNAAVKLLCPVARAMPKLFVAAVPLFRAAMAAFGWLGTSGGGLLVRAEGVRGGRACAVELAITRATHAPLIAVVPASLAVAKILAGEMMPRRGWTPLDSWLTHDELVAAFVGRGCEVSERQIPAPPS
jgi:hypothetical protein